MEENKNYKVLISPDGYQALISLKPDADSPKVTLPELYDILRDHDINYGIKKDVLMLLMNRYNKGQEIDKIVIAEGEEAFPGIQPHVDYKFEISSTPKEDESGRTNYREINKILNIKTGQILAVKRKLKPPRTGYKVSGEEISFLPILDIPVKVGENVTAQESPDFTTYIARCDGALRFENQQLSVFPTLEIRADVDFNVGNIHFEGDVKIGRDVLPDFLVEAAGAISIWGSAIACKLEASEDIEVRAGIVGKNKGHVKTKGNIKATFVENATLEAAGDILIKNGIIGSTIHCDGFLTLEMRRARLVGSTVRAAKGITIVNAGSRFDTGTTLVSGVHPEKEIEYFKIKSALDARWGDAKALEKKYGRSTLENRSFPHGISHELQKDLDRWDFLKKQIKTILQHLQKAEEAMYDYNAVIRVKETLFPRVCVQIGKHKITTTKEYYNITIHYSEEVDTLVVS